MIRLYCSCMLPPYQVGSNAFRDWFGGEYFVIPDDELDLEKSRHVGHKIIEE